MTDTDTKPKVALPKSVQEAVNAARNAAADARMEKDITWAEMLPSDLIVLADYIEKTGRFRTRA